MVKVHRHSNGWSYFYDRSSKNWTAYPLDVIAAKLHAPTRAEIKAAIDAECAK